MDKASLGLCGRIAGKGKTREVGMRDLLECVRETKCYATIVTYVRTFEDPNR